MTTLLVASGGGHLAELHHLAPRLGITGDRAWVTFDSAQSRSLLAGEEVFYVPPATSRDAVGTFRDFLHARRLLATRRFSRVISTGASVALAFFVPAMAAGLRCTYVESATRVDGPSLTGRLSARLRRIELFTQYPTWATGRWRYDGSVFDAFAAQPSPRPASVKKVVVALGTHPRYTFPRLIGRLTEVLPAGADVLWQTGADRQIPFAELQQAMREADVVVTHAGVGSALAALATGHCPVFVPRRRQFGEHIDDHQVQIATSLGARGLVLAREAGAISESDLLTAAATTIVPAGRSVELR
jgi:UDP-N-acetylglucosamine transferase subunit ALG13